PYSNDMEAVVYLEGNELAEEDVDQHYTTRTYAEKAVQFIEEHQNEPFFLYMPHSMPHVPLYVSEKFDGSSDRGLYGDVIQELDWSVGEVLKKLREVGVDENTIVVVSSDNGPWLTMIDHGGSAEPLRCGKQTTFEGGMRVPCVMQWKAQVEAGQTIDGMHNMMDWFPTFAAITGASVPQDRPIDGENIAPVLLKGKERQGDQFMYYSHRTNDIAAYRKGDWKLKLPMERPYGGRYTYEGELPHGMLLFNLVEDPSEQNNLVDQHPEKVAQMQQDIKQFKEDLGETRATHRFKPPADKSHEEYLKKTYGSSQR
ncbi:MAG: sulfatase-like hydrolase/transferase, partial [Bacteroidota bacterium]